MSITFLNAPLVWIVLPGVLAAVLFLIRRWDRPMTLSGIVAALALAWLAWRVPLGERITLGPWSFLPTLEISESLAIFGRQFILNNAARPVLILIYLGIAFWFGGAYIARAGRLFIPLGLAITAFLVAALAVEPFLYAAMLIELAVIISIPMISPPGRPAGPGVQRYLTLVTLAVPLVLLAGWLLGALELNPTNRSLAPLAAGLMTLGLALFLGVFPFHTWFPMLGQDTHPYPAAFLFFVLPGIVSLFALDFLSSSTWLTAAPQVFGALQLLGLLMVLVGGIWAAFQRHLGRLLAFTAMRSVGISIQAISLGLADGLGANSPMLSVYFAQFLPRALALGTAALALSILEQAVEAPEDRLGFRQVRGLGRRLPLAATALFLALFSLAGFPLLPGFSTQLSLWSALAASSPLQVGLSLLGTAGVLVATIRVIAVLVSAGPQETWQIQETGSQRVLLAVGCLVMLMLGIFPELFLPSLAEFARIFIGAAP